MTLDEGRMVTAVLLEKGGDKRFTMEHEYEPMRCKEDYLELAALRAIWEEDDSR